ncbi:autotransporter outer membrane beta-barrel domain-containing protein [Budvicia diplopodorum]|uniref:autotransporter outer membrane beta-barrel domain-containing protein n=1 Tax=Budvicia diplopodorum TaxID=1119056 RepID=UPI00135746C3|nr:autotransporter outer membrane beta-barrel domain-containing protein [Budvicia diplopodorum]
MISFLAFPAFADTEIPTSTSTVTLATLAPGESVFHLPSASTVNAASGDGIYGDGSQPWQLEISGSVSGVVGINLEGDSSVLTNTGAITGTGGNAVTLRGNNSTLILNTGSLLTGNVASFGSGNTLTLEGTGTTNSSFIANDLPSEFNLLNMNGTNWTLNGDVDVKNIMVNSGSLTLTSNIQTNDGHVTIQSGASMQIGDGGTTGEIDGAVIDNSGILAFYRSDAQISLASTLTGSGVIILRGTGVTAQSSYSLAGRNSTFDGNLIIDNARLQVASEDPGLLAHIVVLNGGSLWLGSSRDYSSSVILEGNGWSEGMGQLGALRLDSNANVSGPVTLSGNARITAVFASYIGSISGDIGDGGNGYQLEKTGDGVITLSGANTYSGGTMINSGTIAISADQNLGDVSGAVTLNDGTLLLNNSFTINHNIIFGSAGGTLSNAGANTLSGNLSGAGMLTKNDAGKLSMVSAGSTVGSVQVSAGELALGQTGALTVTNGYLTASGATTSLSGLSSLTVGGVFTQSANSALSLTLGSENPLIISGSASLNGALNVIGLGPQAPNTATGLLGTQFTLLHTLAVGGIGGDFASVNLGGANSPVDYVLLYGGKDANAQDYNIGFELSWLAGSDKANGVFTLANVGDIFNVDMALADRTGTFASGWDGRTLTKQGDGTLILSAVNGYTGATVINGGTLKTGATNVFSSGASLAGVSIASGATLDLNGFDQSISNISGDGHIELGSAQLTINNSVDDSLAAIISGNGTLRKTDTGLLTLSGSSSFSGNTIIDDGSLSVARSKALGTSLVTNNALLSLDIEPHGIFSNQLAGTGMLVKNNSGIAVLTGESSSVGSVAVNSGILTFSQHGDFAVTGDYTNNSGAATVIRGDGVLNIGGNLDMQGTLGIVLGNLDSTTPIIQANTANLGASSVFNVLGFHDDDSTTSLPPGQKNFTIIHTTGINDLTGDFSALNFGGATSPVDYIVLTGNVDVRRQEYNAGILLTWYADGSTTPEIANGLFTLAGVNEEFDLGVRLIDQTANSLTGWDGKTLTKAGDGALTLSKVNRYSGSTLINGGTLRMGVDDAISSSQSVVIAEGALLDLDSFSVNVNALSGTGSVNLGTGQLTVHNGVDESSFSGLISGGGGLVKADSGLWTLTRDNLNTGVTTVADGSLQLGNGGTSGSVAGDIVDNGVLIFNRKDNVQFDNIISGSGQLVKLGAGTLTLNQNNSYSGLTDIREGGLIIGDDSHSQALLASALVKVASGTMLGGYGGVSGDVDNQGTLAVADAVPAFNNSAAGNFTVGGNLTNSGLIVMASPVPSSNLVVHGNYTGNNGLITLSTQLGDDSSPTDRLVIQGNSSGSTVIKVNNAGGAGGQTVNGIQVVSVAGQSDGEFSLANRVVAGAYEYSLYKNGINANDGNWYLRSLSNKPNTPVYRPEAGSYIANVAAAGSLFNLRLTDRDGRAENSSMWLRQSGSQTRFRDGSGQLKTTTNSYVIQGGGEIFSTHFGELDRLGTGLMLGYANADSRTHSNQTRYSSKGSLDGYSAGVYATWYQDAKSLDGVYVDSWVQYNWLNASVDGEQLTSNDYDINGYSASLESGYRMPVYQGDNGLVLITPQAQVIWNNINANDMTEDNGTRVQTNGSDNLQTRLGLRVSREGVSDADKSLNKLFTTYVETNWIYNKTLASVALNGTETQQAGSRNVGELKVGMDGRLNSQLNLWGNVAQQVGGDGYSDTTAMIGVKYQF